MSRASQVDQLCFVPSQYLERILYDYFRTRVPPNIKTLTLNEVIRLISYIGCSMDQDDITFDVKLSLRLKMLLKSAPQLLPVNPGTVFKEWYNNFRVFLKHQLVEIFNQLKCSPVNKKDSHVCEFIKNDAFIRNKSMAEIERNIKELCEIAAGITKPAIEKPVVVQNYVEEVVTTTEDGDDDILIIDNAIPVPYCPPTPSEQVSIPPEPVLLNNQPVQISYPGSSLPPMLATASQLNSRPRGNTSMRGKPFNRNLSGGRLLHQQLTSPQLMPNSQFNVTPPQTPTTPMEGVDFQISCVESLAQDSVAPPQTPECSTAAQLRPTHDQIPVTVLNRSVKDPFLPKMASMSRIKLIEMNTIMDKAKIVSGPIKSVFLDKFFDDYAKCRGNMAVSCITNMQLIRALNDCMTIHLRKRLELYSQVILEIFRFCLTNLNDFLYPDFDRLQNDLTYYNDLLYSFKALIKYVLTLSVGKLSNKLKNMQKHLAPTIPLTQTEISELGIEIYLPLGTPSVGVRLLSQNNIVELKKIIIPKFGFTMTQIYNIPGVTIRCKLANIKFGRRNVSEYSTYLSNSSRRPNCPANKRIIHEIKTKESLSEDDNCALSTKYLTSYFREIITSLQGFNCKGTSALKEVCSEFLKDIDYISPSRKAIAINSEVYCSLSSFEYVVPGFVNTNQVGLRNVINPEVKIFLEECENNYECQLELECNICEKSMDLFLEDSAVRSFSKHVVETHGYYPDSHICGRCNTSIEYGELLNTRWHHMCTL